jgi:uncharacterized protein YcbX
METVGTVVALTRFPVKSMAGESVSSVEVDWQGIEGDRQFAFYRRRDTGRFPWLTGRDVAQMVSWRARFRDPVPRHSAVDVEVQDGQWLALDDERLLEQLAELAGEEVELLQVGRGTHDAMPVSLVSSATHAALDAAHGAALDPRRFRTNVIIEASVPEADWQGRRLNFGGWKDSAELLVAEPIERCVMITIDPDSAARDPAIMRMVVERFDNRVGVHAAPARPGMIRLGDKVGLCD